MCMLGNIDPVLSVCLIFCAFFIYFVGLCSCCGSIQFHCYWWKLGWHASYDGELIAFNQEIGFLSLGFKLKPMSQSSVLLFT